VRVSVRVRDRDRVRVRVGLGQGEIMGDRTCMPLIELVILVAAPAAEPLAFRRLGSSQVFWSALKWVKPRSKQR